MTWYKNYLAAETQPWARQVQKEVDNLKNNFRTAEVNNLTRDDQLASSLRQVSSASTAASQAAIEAASAAQAAADANALATTANATAITANSTAISANSTAITANTNALEALQDIIDLSSPGGPTISAANITADFLSGNRISGGEIVGTTLKTASSGPRLELLQNDMNFYDDNGNYSGSIIGDGVDRASTLELTWGNVSGVYIYNGGLELYANGVVGVNAQGLAVYGGFISSSSVDTGSVSCSSVSSTGSVSGNGVSSSGTLTRTQLIGGGTTGASITDGGNFVRTSSSQRYKTDIQLLDIDLNDLYAVEPKTFKRIEEVEEHGESANTYPGFIAEELAGTSLDKFVFYSKDEDGNPRPEGIHYPELTAALLLAIKDLNQRITTLEAKV